MSPRPPRRHGAAAGHSLLTALITLAVVSVLLGLGTLTVRRQVARQEALTAARRVVSELRLRRAEAIARSRRQGVVFERVGQEWLVSVHADGDGDGVRADDRRSGVDPLLSGPQAFHERYGALGPGFLPGLESLRSPPPGSRLLPDLEDPVRFGPGDVVSFSPNGRTTPGTLYLTDGAERQFAVVVVGVSSRVRVWEWLPNEDRWLRR